MMVIEEALASGYSPILVSQNSTPLNWVHVADSSPYVVVMPSTGSRTFETVRLWQPKRPVRVDEESRARGFRSEDLAQLLLRLEALASQVRRVEQQLESSHQIVPEPHLEALRWMEAATGLSQERIGDLLGVSRQTLRNWREGTPIAPVNRQRVFAVRDVLERAALRYPGKPELAAWLDTPQGTEGRTPAQLLQAGRIDEARYSALARHHFKVAPTQVKRVPVQARRGWTDQTRRAKYHDQDEELLALYGQPGGDDEDE